MSDKLTYDKAIATLPKGKRIHTFRRVGSIWLGADWPRRDILKTIKNYGAELLEKSVANHRLYLNDGRELFIDTIAPPPPKGEPK